MRFLFSILFLFNANFVSAQNTNPYQPFEIGKIEEIHSAILNETRTINIYLPVGYSADTLKTCPVIYLLDGSANEDFIHIAGLAQFLTMIEKMPPTIVVGIANVDRKRDFTFPTTIKKDLLDFPTTGFSTKFISFIEEELQPLIHSKYSTSSSKTIIGQSLGGLLATEILLKKPQLFSNYLIVSPSLWWNNESLLRNPLTEINKTDGKKVFIAVGKEGQKMEADAKKFADLIRLNKKISVKFNPLPKENHLTILHNGAYQGLEFLFHAKPN